MLYINLYVYMILSKVSLVVFLCVVPTPAIFRSPNQSTYYPGEYVTLMCVLQDMYMDDQTEYQYRWSFAPEIVEMNGTNFPGPNLTLVPHYNETGDYTCYANTNNTYTIESEGNATTIKVLCKLIITRKHEVVRCML